MWHALSLSEIKQKLKTNYQFGLTNEEAEKRYIKHGLNKLEDKPKESLVIKFFKQFNDFMIIILIIASIVSAVITKMQGENDYIDSIIIIAIVVLNAVMGVIQEYKAEKSLEALKNMTTPKVNVRREGRVKLINSTELVPRRCCFIRSWKFCTSRLQIN